MHALMDGEKLPSLIRPIAVFDAGIGSYAAVAAIQRILPQQDVLYFADRASFPYGGKSPPELLAILRRTLRFLDTYNPAAVLVASNAPSITVLDDLMGMIARPVFGVRPPIALALELAETSRYWVCAPWCKVRNCVPTPTPRPGNGRHRFALWTLPHSWISWRAAPSCSRLKRRRTR